MFQASAQRLRTLMTLVDEMLADSEPEPGPHPHRQPVRIERVRRAGAVAARPAHCLSPVRPGPSPARPAPEHVR